MGCKMKTSLLTLAFAISVSMASWTDTTFVPPSLGFPNPLAVFLPEGYQPGGTEDYQVMIWLHGWNNHYWDDTTSLRYAHDALVSQGLIAPCIMVCPEGWCQPYLGSMWANSGLYGNYEGYVAEDVVAFIDSSYCTMGDEARYIMGNSMGGSGALDIALRHPELFSCVCVNAAVPDMVVGFPYVIEEVLKECPETEPPYTYDWGNGFYTNSQFMYAGGYSPNLNAPDSVDFPLDEYGLIVDSVYALWELHNAAHMVRTEPPSDLHIGLAWGLNDPQVGLVESNYAFADTLSDLGLPFTVYTDNYSHSPPTSRLQQMFLIAMEWSSTGTGHQQYVHGLRLLPNPAAGSVTAHFDLSGESAVSIGVYDMAGKRVMDMPEFITGQGNVSLELDLSRLPPGVYQVLVGASGETLVSRLVLLD